MVIHFGRQILFRTQQRPGRILCCVHKGGLKYSTTASKESRELGSLVESNRTHTVYGQPTHQTHPHLLTPGEILPGLQKHEFIERRQSLFQKILSTDPKANHVVVIPSAKRMYMSEKIPYMFRQNTDFLYLTGCTEPDCVLLLAGSSEDDLLTTLFLRRKDKHAEKWDGPRTGVEGALHLFGVDQAFPFTELKKYLLSSSKELGKSKFTLWYDFGSSIHPEVHSVLVALSSTTSCKIESPKPMIHGQRLVKSAAEQKLMVKTCEIAGVSMAKTMAFTRPGVTEHMLFAKMDFECRMNGADCLAYPPVVAAGNNANTIHYISNLQKTEEDEMVLVDAGCSVSGYCSDLTRTWPVSGQFTGAQQVLYEVVLETQSQLLGLCHPEHSLDHLFNVMCSQLGNKLIEAGVFKKTANLNHPSKLAYELCPHHASHYLGMDVHDTGTVSRSIAMRPGMVITVEPGLYVAENNEDVHKDFLGQGIRIEDNVLISESNPILLTATCPKDVEEVEKLVGSSLL